MDHQRGIIKDRSFRKGSQPTVNEAAAVNVFQAHIIAQLNGQRDVQMNTSKQDYLDTKEDLYQDYNRAVKEADTRFQTELRKIENKRQADIAELKVHWKNDPRTIPDKFKASRHDSDQEQQGDQQQEDQTQAVMVGQDQQRAATVQSPSSAPERSPRQDLDFDLGELRRAPLSEPRTAVQAAETRTSPLIRFQLNTPEAGEPATLNTAAAAQYPAHLVNSANGTTAAQQQPFLQPAAMNRTGIMFSARRNTLPATRHQQVAEDEIMSTNAWVKYSDAKMTEAQLKYLKTSGMVSLNRITEAKVFKDHLSPDYYERVPGAMDLQTLSNRLKGDMYRSVRSFAKAFYSLVENIRTFYGDDDHPLTTAVNGMAYHFEHQVMRDLPAGDEETSQMIDLTNGSDDNDDIAGEE